MYICTCMKGDVHFCTATPNINKREEYTCTVDFFLSIWPPTLAATVGDHVSYFTWEKKCTGKVKGAYCRYVSVYMSGGGAIKTTSKILLGLFFLYFYSGRRKQSIPWIRIQIRHFLHLSRFSCQTFIELLTKGGVFKRTGRGSVVCTYYARTGRKWLVNQAHSTQSRKEGSEGEGEDAGYMVRLVARSVKARMWWCGVCNLFPSFKVA